MYFTQGRFYHIQIHHWDTFSLGKTQSALQWRQISKLNDTARIVHFPLMTFTYQDHYSYYEHVDDVSLHTSLLTHTHTHTHTYIGTAFFSYE